MSFVSICAYNYFNEEMNLSNVLTGLFIFSKAFVPSLVIKPDIPPTINGIAIAQTRAIRLYMAPFPRDMSLHDQMPINNAAASP